jgi:putative two-component system response regulator
MDKQLTLQKVLIVDDTPENIDILREILSDYNLSMATNGEKALKVANADNPPDLILLDIMMPGLDGFEVCRRLKANAKTKKIPVIFLTAKSDLESETKGLELGAVDYINIPVSPPIILQRLKTHFSLQLAVETLEKDMTEKERKLIATQIRARERP